MGLLRILVKQVLGYGTFARARPDKPWGDPLGVPRKSQKPDTLGAKCHFGGSKSGAQRRPKLETPEPFFNFWGKGKTTPSALVF